MTLSRVNPEMITSLKRELNQIRQQSLQATRQGDFMKVARLTTVAAQINKSIMDAEGGDRIAHAVRDGHKANGACTRSALAAEQR